MSKGERQKRAMATAEQVRKWTELRVKEWRTLVPDYPQVQSVAVTCALLSQGDTFDDEITERRWVFNKLGELIGTRHMRNCSKHAWRPGLHGQVNTA